MNFGGGNNPPWAQQSRGGSGGGGGGSHGYGGYNSNFAPQQNIGQPGLAMPTSLSAGSAGGGYPSRTSSQQNSGSSSSTASSVNQRVFTGVITKVSDNFGFVDEDVFFQTSVCKGGIPKLGDRVLVEATFNANMPFKWNASRIQLIPNQQPVAPQQQQVLQQQVTAVQKQMSALQQAQLSASTYNPILNTGECPREIWFVGGVIEHISPTMVTRKISIPYAKFDKLIDELKLQLQLYCLEAEAQGHQAEKVLVIFAAGTLEIGRSKNFLGAKDRISELVVREAGLRDELGGIVGNVVITSMWPPVAEKLGAEHTSFHANQYSSLLMRFYNKWAFIINTCNHVRTLRCDKSFYCAKGKYKMIASHVCDDGVNLKPETGATVSGIVDRNIIKNTAEWNNVPHREEVLLDAHWSAILTADKVYVDAFCGVCIDEIVVNIPFVSVPDPNVAESTQNKKARKPPMVHNTVPNLAESTINKNARKLPMVHKTVVQGKNWAPIQNNFIQGGTLYSNQHLARNPESGTRAEADSIKINEVAAENPNIVFIPPPKMKALKVCQGIAKMAPKKLEDEVNELLKQFQLEEHAVMEERREDDHRRLNKFVKKLEIFEFDRGMSVVTRVGYADPSQIPDHASTAQYDPDDPYAVPPNSYFQNEGAPEIMAPLNKKARYSERMLSQVEELHGAKTTKYKPSYPQTATGLRPRGHLLQNQPRPLLSSQNAPPGKRSLLQRQMADSGSPYTARYPMRANVSKICANPPIFQMMGEQQDWASDDVECITVPMRLDTLQETRPPVDRGPESRGYNERRYHNRVPEHSERSRFTEPEHQPNTSRQFVARGREQQASWRGTGHTNTDDHWNPRPSLMNRGSEHIKRSRFTEPEHQMYTSRLFVARGREQQASVRGTGHSNTDDHWNPRPSLINRGPEHRDRRRLAEPEHQMYTSRQFVTRGREKQASWSGTGHSNTDDNWDPRLMNRGPRMPYPREYVRRMNESCNIRPMAPRY